MKDLVIIAHPDDEIFWFSSILFRNNPDVICVTTGRDVEDKEYRLKAFTQIMEMLNLKNYYLLGFPDTDQRVELENLEKALSPFIKKEYDKVFTHGPYGEIFNNKHHQDVCYIVYKLFKNTYSIAWNIYPDIVNTLTTEEYDLKKFLLGTIYFKEYINMMDAYQISSTEEFVKLDSKSIEIYYWAIANFGDHHEKLSNDNEDFWGFGYSPYEIERHAAILSLSKKVSPNTILEFGACEGILTDKLSKNGSVDCVERVTKYKNILKNKGYKVVQDIDTREYDLSVVASFLEYVKQPFLFLKSIKSEYLVLDVIVESNLDIQIDHINFGYKKLDEILVQGRWERMFHNGKKSKLPVYKLGTRCLLYKKI